MNAKKVIKKIDESMKMNEDSNDDKTAKQIYDELGRDKFVEYLKDIAYKSVRQSNIQWLSKMKFSPDMSHISDSTIILLFTQRQPPFIHTYSIIYENGELRVSCYFIIIKTSKIVEPSSRVVISPSQTNIAKAITTGISKFARFTPPLANYNKGWYN